MARIPPKWYQLLLMIMNKIMFFSSTHQWDWLSVWIVHMTLYIDISRSCPRCYSQHFQWSLGDICHFSLATPLASVQAELTDARCPCGGRTPRPTPPCSRHPLSPPPQRASLWLLVYIFDELHQKRISSGEINIFPRPKMNNQSSEWHVINEWCWYGRVPKSTRPKGPVNCAPKNLNETFSGSFLGHVNLLFSYLSWETDMVWWHSSD